MHESKPSPTPPLADFQGGIQEYGFKDKNSTARTVLQRLKAELELQNLKQSAALYTEVYEEDLELLDLTEAAIRGWPE